MPIRILLVVAVAFLGAWMTVLKPKSDGGAPAAPASTPTAPGVKGLTNDINKAKAAKATQEASDARVQAATGEQPAGAGAATAPATSAGSAPAAKGARAAGKVDTSGLPAGVRSAIAAHRVVVLLFWDRRSADDRAVRAALRDVKRRHGRVYVQAVPVAQVARYGKIARGVDLSQSPTVVVIDRAMKARTLVGYVDAQSIDQVVVDALHSTGMLISDPYLRRVNRLCDVYGRRLSDVPHADQPGGQVTGTVRQLRATWSSFAARFEGMRAPVRWRAFKAGAARDFAAYDALLTSWSRFLGPHPSAVRVAQSLVRFEPRERAISKRSDKRMDAQDLLSCGSNS